MDNFSDILKEKIATPFLSNFFFGILLFNKKVIYSAFSISNEDKIGDYYFYNFYPYQNKIELLEAVHKDEIYICSPSLNLFVLPIIYAAIITGSLPFIKAFFKTLNVRAGLWHTALKKKYAKLKTVSKEEFDEVEKDLFKYVNELEQAKGVNGRLTKANIDLGNDNSSLTAQLATTSAEVNTLKSENQVSRLEFEKLKDGYLSLNDELETRQKTIAEVFQGVWQLDYTFQPPSELPPGIEIFKIVNGCEIHRADSPDSEFSFRAFVDRYEFKVNALRKITDTDNPNGKMFHKIKFKKTFLKAKEYAFCEYTLIDKDTVEGIEIYTLDNGETTHAASLNLKRIK